MQRTLNDDNIMHVEAIATSGQTRSSRERQATPFFKDEDVWISRLSYKVVRGLLGCISIACLPQDFDVHEGGRSVNFDDTISTEACGFEQLMRSHTVQASPWLSRMQLASLTSPKFWQCPGLRMVVRSLLESSSTTLRTRKLVLARFDDAHPWI